MTGMSILAARGLRPQHMNWMMPSAPHWPASLLPRAKSGEWDATSRTWNKLLAAPHRMDAVSAGGRRRGGSALRQVVSTPVIRPARAAHLQPRHRTHHLSLLLELSPARRGSAVLAAQLFRRQKTCAPDRGRDPVARHAALAARAAE